MSKHRGDLYYMRCFGKMAYDTYGSAKDAGKYARSRWAKRLVIYKCSFCHCWHKGSDPGRYNNGKR